MTTLHILSPADLVPGATAPDGRVVLYARFVQTDTAATVIVAYETGPSEVLTWPSAAGWSSPAGYASVTHPAPKEDQS